MDPSHHSCTWSCPLGNNTGWMWLVGTAIQHSTTNPPTPGSRSDFLPGIPLPSLGHHVQERAKSHPPSDPDSPSGEHCTRTYGWVTWMWRTANREMTETDVNVVAVQLKTTWVLLVTITMSKTHKASLVCRENETTPFLIVNNAHFKDDRGGGHFTFPSPA